MNEPQSRADHSQISVADRGTGQRAATPSFVSAPARPTCRFCGRPRSSAELLEVRDLLTGDRFGVCRPGLDEPGVGICFRAGVGSADRFAIAPAVDERPVEAIVR